MDRKNFKDEYIEFIEKRLLPCPFCDSKVYVSVKNGVSKYNYNEIYFDISCPNSKCFFYRGSDINFDDYEFMINLWNNRKNNKIRISKISKMLEEKN
jgi:hypothetical protein